MVITNKKRKPSLTLKIDDNIINQNTCIKYLGVLIDDSLDWNAHIHRVCSKVASGCLALRQLQPYRLQNSFDGVLLTALYIHT